MHRAQQKNHRPPVWKEDKERFVQENPPPELVTWLGPGPRDRGGLRDTRSQAPRRHSW